LFPLQEFRLKLAKVGEDAGMARTLQMAALPRSKARQVPAAATLAALGIVYGDIGTSPLYGFKQAADAAGTISPATIVMRAEAACSFFGGTALAGEPKPFRAATFTARGSERPACLRDRALPDGRDAIYSAR
jgi:hypothetical protein